MGSGAIALPERHTMVPQARRVAKADARRPVLDEQARFLARSYLSALSCLERGPKRAHDGILLLIPHLREQR